MVFSSPQFLFLFLPFVLLLTAWGSLCYQNVALIACSLAFYYYSGGELIWLLLFSCGANWLMGLILDHSRSRLALLAGVLVNVGILVYYKYANFIVSEINRWAHGTRWEIPQWSAVTLPIGISFFTFQGMSYMLDVWRRETRAYRNPLDILLCISFFPHLIAGPIVRINHLGQQLRQRSRSLDDMCAGASRFLWGLAKKVLIADYCARVADAGFGSDADTLPPQAAWLALLAYTLQIYFDFSGYSDMAIGLARLFGFRFPENFNHPYASVSITDFWRRWHMSLSQWFRDYLYIPLGGNRGPKFAHYRNVLFVFLVTGLWHGASWTFVLWGLYHGILVACEHALGLHKMEDDHRFATPRRALTLLLVMGSWVLFRCKTFGDALMFFQALGGRFHHQYVPVHVIDLMDLQTFLALAFGVTSFFARREGTGGRWIEAGTPRAMPFRWAMMLLVYPVILGQMFATNYSPFLYFRF